MKLFTGSSPSSSELITTKISLNATLESWAGPSTQIAELKSMEPGSDLTDSTDESDLDYRSCENAEYIHIPTELTDLIKEYVPSS